MIEERQGRVEERMCEQRRREEKGARSRGERDRGKLKAKHVRSKDPACLASTTADTGVAGRWICM